LTYSRLLSAVLFSLGVVIVILIGWEISSPATGIFSGIILSMLPFSLGLSQLVTTESLKIFIYPLTVYAYIHLIKKFSWKKVLIAGLVTGLALQAKQSDFLVILLLGIMFFFQYFKIKPKEKMIFAEKRIIAFAAVIIIGISVFFLIWPQAILHFKEVSSINTKLWLGARFSSNLLQFTFSPPEVFRGRLIMTPIYYYILYFFITIPLLVLLLFLAGIVEIFKKKNIYLFAILLWFILPFSLSIYPWRQHGLRYIIEIYPAIAIISAIGFEAIVSLFIKSGLKKYVLFLLVIIYLFISLWRIKPYYLDYFNEIIGGVNNVYRHNLFQTGWWGQGLGEAGMYLKNNAKKDSAIGLAISPEHVFPKFDNLKYSEWSLREKYDYVVVNNYHIIRDGFNAETIKKRYSVVYRVKADQAVLVTVYRLK
jgi:4-amino-4-deoxy-L-arabinose transferase-like glycosyltransferase